MPVLATENGSERGNADPYTLRSRCKPQEVLLYVIIALLEAREAKRFPRYATACADSGAWVLQFVAIVKVYKPVA